MGIREGYSRLVFNTKSPSPPEHFVRQSFSRAVSRVQSCPEHKKLLTRHNFPAECLTLEITETALLENQKVCLPNLFALKDLGCRIDLDDFEKGYSSMSYLKTLPADYVKIDKEFVKNLDQDNKVIASSIVALIYKLGRYTIA